MSTPPKSSVALAGPAQHGSQSFVDSIECAAEDDIVGTGRPITLETLHLVVDPWQPSLSPTGRRVAYQHRGPDPSAGPRAAAVRALELADGSGDVRELPLPPGASGWPAWTPDGGALVMYARRPMERGGLALYDLVKVRVPFDPDADEVEKLKTVLSPPKLIRCLGDGTIAFFVQHDLFADRFVAATSSSMGTMTARETRIFTSFDEAGTGAKRLRWRDLMELHQARHGFVSAMTLGAWDYVTANGGELLAFSGMATDTPHYWIDQDIYVQRGGGPPVRLRTRGGRDIAPRFSRDGRYLAVGTKREIGTGSWDFDRLHVYAIDGKDATGTLAIEVIGEEGGDESALFVPEHWEFVDERRLIFSAWHKGKCSVHLLDVGKFLEDARGACPVCVPLRKTQAVVELGEQIEQMVSTADGTGDVSIVIRKGTNFAPPELFHLRVREGKTDQPVQITKCRADSGVRESNLDVTVRRLELRAGSGRRIEVYISHPGEPESLFRDGAMWPLIQMLHGGPHEKWAPRFDRRFNGQSLAAEGYIVAQVNFHGSLGHPLGEQFAQSLSDHWGELPAEDIRLTTEHLIQEYPVDIDRIGLIGGSYGAYLGAWILGHKRTGFRFRAGVLHAGPYDLATLYSENEYWVRMHQFRSAPWDGDLGESLSRMSPLRHSPFYSAPTLLTHGHEDDRVPASNSVMLHRMLVDKKVPSALVVYPGMGHTIAPAYLPDWWRRTLAWLNDHGVPARRPDRSP